MDKKKLCFLCPSPSWGGLEMNVFRQALWLRDYGYEIHFCGLEKTPLCERFRHNDFACRPIDSLTKFDDLPASFKLKEYLNSENITDIFFHLNRNFLLAAITNIISGGKFRFFYQQHMQPGGSKKDPFHTYLYNNVEKFIVPLEMYADKIKSISNIKHEKVAVVPFGIELDRFTAKRPSKKDARIRLNLSPDRTIIGVVGRLDPKKGQHILIEASALLKHKGYDFDLVFIGDRTRNENSGYDKKLDQLIRTHSLENTVKFRPHLEQIEHAYAALDMFVLTSLSETYGMVTIEAMASELPVIATDSGGTPGLITHEKNGLLVRPEHPKELAGKIASLLDDPRKAKRLAVAASLDAYNIYSKDSQIKKLDCIFSNG